MIGGDLLDRCEALPQTTGFWRHRPGLRGGRTKTRLRAVLPTGGIAAQLTVGPVIPRSVLATHNPAVGGT